jgi:hypothetical protein
MAILEGTLIMEIADVFERWLFAVVLAISDRQLILSSQCHQPEMTEVRQVGITFFLHFGSYKRRARIYWSRTSLIFLRNSSEDVGFLMK